MLRTGEGRPVRSDIAFAATAGMLAAFNPCGFALLPTYLAIFLGTPSSRSSSTTRALLVGASVTAGFVAVFGAAGIAVVLLSLSLGRWLSWVTLASGVLLLALGGWLISGRELRVRIPRARVPVSGSVAGMVSYGVVYASVSLSCTLPVYLAAVAYVFGDPASGPLAGGLAAIAYAVGMGVVLTTLALVVALLDRAAATRVRSWTRHVGRVSGAFAMAAGLYVLWYGWVELATLRGGSAPAGPVAWVTAASGHVSQTVNRIGPYWLSATAAAVFVAAGVGSLVRRRRPR
jgi:cytochrome c-type biogenesis protein